MFPAAFFLARQSANCPLFSSVKLGQSIPAIQAGSAAFCCQPSMQYVPAWIAKDGAEEARISLRFKCQMISSFESPNP